MAGKSVNSIGAKNWAPNSPATRYNVSGKNREFYTFENAPGLGNYATGGTIIDGGDGYIYHIFTGDGTFVVPPESSPRLNSVDYLIVAGGGAGGAGSGTTPGGGGGAGGMLFGNAFVTTGSYPIDVGGGGTSNAAANPSASRHGVDSSAFGLTAEGGGGGGSNSPPSTGHTNGDPGGSGGGASSAPPTAGRPGGTGNTPETTPRQGYPGAPSSMPSGTSPAIGGGGGGAGGAGGYGANGDPVGPPFVPRGYGGPGRLVPQFPIPIIGKAIPSTNYPVWYNDVAEGSTYSGNSGGGLSAGGRAWPPPSNSSPQLNATANTGHGGIGQTTSPGFNGGSGIVCIKYKKNVPYTRATGGTVEPSTDPNHPGVWRHIFTSPGDFTVTDPTLQYVDYLAVGGGGGGGGVYGGGGGAGGFVSSIYTSPTTPTAIPEAYPWNPGYSVQVGEQYTVGIGTYAVVIGTGGAGGSGISSPGTQGNPTTIGTGPTQINANGGGFGGGGSPPPLIAPGGSGGSGGGAGRAGPLGPPTPSVGSGLASPSPLIQGNPGVSTLQFPGAHGGSGGGGGSAATGGSVGSGWYSVLSPSAYGTPGPLTPTPQYRYFAGGGGGGRGVSPAPTTGQAGGAGGGGAGGSVGVSTGTPGTVNTGGGGGGGANSPTYSIGGSGGPGIVIIQYPE